MDFSRHLIIDVVQPVRPFYGLGILVVYPLLPPSLPHIIVKMPHEHDIIHRLGKVVHVSGDPPQAHRESGREICHLVPVAFGHIEGVAVFQVGDIALGILKGRELFEVGGRKVDVFPRYQGVGHLVKVFCLRGREENAFLFALEMKVKDVGKINIIMHEDL